MPKFTSPDKIKVGVIGYGGAFNMGKSHLEEMKKAGMTPVAVCELDEERLKIAKEDFSGIQTYTDISSMLEQSDVNLITIITPHNLHAQQAIQCLEAGKHVVCEKPLAITTDECDAMIKAAKENDVVLSTYHNRHWDGCILQAVKDIKEDNLIGDVIRVEAHMGNYSQPNEWWRSSKAISGGIMYDWGVHLLEYSLQLVDGNMKEVSGFAKKGFWGPKTSFGSDCNEDEGFLTVRFDNGKWLTLTVTSIDNKPKSAERGMLEITGTEGTYLMFGGKYTLIKKDGANTVTTEGKALQGEGWKLYQNIADHLVKDEELVITPEWARRPIHILDLGCKSAEEGLAQKAIYS